MFKFIIKQQSGVPMNTERGFPHCNHSSCSYWILKDPLNVFSMEVMEDKIHSVSTQSFNAKMHLKVNN